MLFCDSCDRGFHMECCDPPLSRMPKGELLFTPIEDPLATSTTTTPPPPPPPSSCVRLSLSEPRVTADLLGAFACTSNCLHAPREQIACPPQRGRPLQAGRWPDAGQWAAGRIITDLLTQSLSDQTIKKSNPEFS